MNFNIFRAIASSVQTRPGIRVPTPVAHQQTFHVPSPVRLLPRVKSLPVIALRAPYGTEEVTTIIQNQRANPGLSDFLINLFKRIPK